MIILKIFFILLLLIPLAILMLYHVSKLSDEVTGVDNAGSSGAGGSKRRDFHEHSYQKEQKQSGRGKGRSDTGGRHSGSYRSRSYNEQFKRDEQGRVSRTGSDKNKSRKTSRRKSEM